MFSINEIWKFLEGRLVELKIMKDPGAGGGSDCSDEDSVEVDDDFDFEKLAKERVKFLFRGRRGASKQDKSVGDLLKPNDL
jgi:hypothetical protein